MIEQPQPRPQPQEPLLRQIIREHFRDMIEPQLSELWRQVDPDRGLLVERVAALESKVADLEIECEHLRAPGPGA